MNLLVLIAHIEQHVAETLLGLGVVGRLVVEHLRAPANMITVNAEDARDGDLHPKRGPTSPWGRG